MKPFNNCYVIKNNTNKTIKIISMENKVDFFDYLLDRLNFDNELTITTGLYEGKAEIKSTERQNQIYTLPTRLLQ